MINRGSRLACVVAATLSGAGFAAGVPGVALAQQADPGRHEGLEEVVVTAQRREQVLQDVPISMQVVGTDLIADVAAEDLGDLDGYVPGLLVSSASPTQPRYAIRGIQTGDFGVGTDPAVGVYVDGVYSARSGASMLAFNDIERIEVLKGPQGTLFGRNSAAGAISIVTRQPAQDFDALLKLRFGDHGKQYYEGMLNTPVTDSVALRVNGLYNTSDGWVKDGVTGKDLWPEDNWALRAALRWEASENTTATFSWDHDELDQLARPAFGLVQTTPDQTAFPYPADPDTYLDPRRSRVYNDVIGNEESRSLDQLNLFVDHRLGWADFRSTTSWRQFETVNREDEDGTNNIGTYFDTANIESNESFYQEFKLSGTTDRLDWVAGVSYYRENAYQTSDTLTFTNSIDTMFTNLGLYDDLGIVDEGGNQVPLYTATSEALAFLGIVYPDGSPVTMLGLPWTETMYNHGQYEATALFGDAIWHLTDRTNLTVGLRYTHDAKTFSWQNGPHQTPQLDQVVALLEAGGFFTVWPIPPVAYRLDDVVFRGNTPDGGRKAVKENDSWNDLSPRLVLDYAVSPDLMVFGSVAKGYKAGGYNSVEVGSTFDNEDVWNVEAGVKSLYSQVGVMLNASTFYYLYKDKQAISLVTYDDTGIPQYLIDTSDEQAWGIDFEARWQPYDPVMLYANLAFIDATYKDKTTTGSSPVSLDGEPTGEPYLSAALGASYVWMLGSRGDLDLSGRYAWRGETRCNKDSTVQGTCDISPNFEVGESTQRLDVRLAWSSTDDKYGLAAFVTNVLDDQYVTGVNNLTEGTFGTPFAMISEPRMWGLEATIAF